MLLDILLVFRTAAAKRMFSRDLVQALVGFGERPWMELSKAKAVTEGWLAQQLRPYGLRPRTIRIGERRAKSYADADLMETYRRYTSEVGPGSVDGGDGGARERAMPATRYPN